jgi:hypothetical protein
MLIWSGFLATDLEDGVRFPAQRNFRELLGLERAPLGLVSTTEELLDGKSSGSGPEI